MLNFNTQRILSFRPRMALIRKRSLLAALLTLCLTPAAHAIVIQNGGFEADTLAPWETTGGATASVGANISPPDGARIAVIGIFPDQPGSFLQSFNLADAGMFDYAFRAGRSENACGCNDVPLTFAVRIDGTILSTVLPAFSSSGSGGHFGIELLSSYTGSLFLPAGSHVLSFDFSRGETLFGRAPYFALDGVSVTPQEVAAPQPPSADAVPEPITLPLLGAGLAGIALQARRRKQTHAALIAA